MQDTTRDQLQGQLDMARYLYQNLGTTYAGQGGTMSERLERYNQASRTLRQYDQTGRES